MKKTTVTVEKKLILEFSLPGFRGSMSHVDNDDRGLNRSYSDVPKQLERNRERHEHWTLELSLHNAVDTRDVLRELATQIDVLLAEGRF